MTTETTNGAASSVPRRRTDELLTGLAERLGATFTASSVFGDPVERDGVTVIPVATVRLGFGGGGGEDASGAQSGEGGGGGGFGSPAGYIEIKDGRSRFVPIVNPARAAAIGSGVALATAVAWRVARGPRGRARAATPRPRPARAARSERGCRRRASRAAARRAP